MIPPYEPMTAANGRAYCNCGSSACSDLADEAKGKNGVSGNMIHARELDINMLTTVSELFELIDLQFRITKHAQLSIVSRSADPSCVPTRTLRLEWCGEPE
jgi:hypothetical protein